MNINSVDMNILVVFIAVVEEGSVTGAARRVGRTQSAVSHALNRLRNMFDDPLLVRAGDRMVPTSRAMELYESFNGPVKQIDSTLNKLGGFIPQETERVFSFGMSDSAAATLLPPFLESFRELAPKAKLKVRTMSTRRALDALKFGALDVVVQSSPISEDWAVSKELASYPFFCAAAKELVGSADKMTLNQYLSLSHLLINVEGEMFGTVDQSLREIGLSRQVVATVPFYLVSPALVANSDLVASFASNILPAFRRQEGISTFELPFHVPPIKLFTVQNASKIKDAGQDWLVSLLETSTRNML